MDRHLQCNKKLTRSTNKTDLFTHMLSLYNAIPLMIVTQQNQNDPPGIKQITGDHIKNVVCNMDTQLSVLVTYVTFFTY